MIKLNQVVTFISDSGLKLQGEVIEHNDHAARILSASGLYVVDIANVLAQEDNEGQARPTLSDLLKIKSIPRNSEHPWFAPAGIQRGGLSIINSRQNISGSGINTGSFEASIGLIITLLYNDRRLTISENKAIFQEEMSSRQRVVTDFSLTVRSGSMPDVRHTLYQDIAAPQLGVHIICTNLIELHGTTIIKLHPKVTFDDSSKVKTITLRGKTLIFISGDDN